MSVPTSFHAFLDSDDWRIDSVEKFSDSTINEKIDGETPLTRVLQNPKCSLEIVKLLLDHGANVCDRIYDEEPPVVCIALEYSRNEAIIEALLQKAENLDNEIYGMYMCTALRHGASKGVIKLLLNADCYACEYHDSALHCAAQLPYVSMAVGVLELLLDNGALQGLRFSRSPICCAFKAGCGTQDIELLIRNGIDLNMCEEHNSPWFCATHVSLPFTSDIVKLIHVAGFSMDVLDDAGWSPLQYALLNCNCTTGAIKLMIKELGIQALTNSNSSLLHLAVGSDYCKLEIVKLLVDAGLRVNQLDNNGEIPLHRAVMSQSSALFTILKYLLEQGSSVDLRNKGGFTPLRKLLFKCFDCSVIKLLLEAGASIDPRFLKKKFKEYNDRCHLYSYSICNDDSCYCSKTTSDVIKLLLKFSFLRNIDFQVGEFIEHLEDCDEWAKFAGDCVKEVQKLNSKFLYCPHNLQDFVLGSCKHLIYVDTHLETIHCNFKRFLRIMAMNAFPLFFEDISAKVDVELLKLHLQNKSVYTTTMCGEKTIRLDDDSLSWLFRYLSQADLLNMIIAYYLY